MSSETAAILTRPFERLGASLLRFVEQVGAITLIFVLAMKWLPRRPFRFKLLIKQFDFIGVQSTFIIFLTSLFTGGVFSLQSSQAFRLFEANTMVGPTVVLALTRELGPVLTALMVIGRVGSSMAAEIGTMRVTEQIDALETMAVSPIHYLVVPRLIASVIMMPMLTTLFDFIGTMGSYFVTTVLLSIPSDEFVEQVVYYVDFDDFYIGIVKAAVFGLIMATIGCYKGYYTSGGAEGVGRATTESVVLASVAVMIANYFLTALMF
ncbi:MAG: ABC transporter permease [Candidatus Lernaella stagnicola]|nr:ABC transporter permease [Candidatus Lernaella stagnicola]